MEEETITIAILAKDKAHCLPLYLKCLLAQTFPKERTYLYIRTNDNKDNTNEILSNWIHDYGYLYKEVYFDTTSLDPELMKYAPHEWNSFRFSILGRIRQESVQWARKKGSHYFVADCDNFIHPQTIEILLATRLPVVGPFLVTGNNMYSNYHHQVDKNGYLRNGNGYHLIYHQEITGLIEVAVIHCTYLIRKDVLEKVSYLPDGTDRHEYVIFSENLRQQNIRQYLDNRHIYGRITFTDTPEDFSKESWLDEFGSSPKI